jgi:hypothetical protein
MHPLHGDLSQQTPSAIAPDVHWKVEVAAVPFGSFDAQVFFVVSQ